MRFNNYLIVIFIFMILSCNREKSGLQYTSNKGGYQFLKEMITENDTTYIKGVVKELDTQKPIEGALVALRNYCMDTLTGSKGEFMFKFVRKDLRPVPTKSPYLEVSKSVGNYAQLYRHIDSEYFNPRAGEVYTINFYLQKNPRFLFEKDKSDKIDSVTQINRKKNKRMNSLK